MWNYEDAPEQQIQYLQDDAVTFSEYAEAFLATMQCLAAKGLVVKEIDLNDDGTQYAARFLPSDESSAAARKADSIYESCHELHASFVELMYFDRLFAATAGP